MTHSNDHHNNIRSLVSIYLQTKLLRIELVILHTSNKTMASTMQLEFEEAMSDFKTMFPDMEKEVIEAVLRANQGAVDATIDQLLAMSVDNQVRRFFFYVYQIVDCKTVHELFV